MHCQVVIVCLLKSIVMPHYSISVPCSFQALVRDVEAIEERAQAAEETVLVSCL